MVHDIPASDDSQVPQLESVWQSTVKLLRYGAAPQG